MLHSCVHRYYETAGRASWNGVWTSGGEGAEETKQNRRKNGEFLLGCAALLLSLIHVLPVSFG